MAVISGGLVLPGVREPVFDQALGSPALGTATAVHAAVADTGSPIVITTAITNPDVPRNITATPSGTTANVTAVQCIVTGTNIFDQVITETLPAFSAGAATAVTGVKAFKTVTSITQPACGASVSISYGVGSKLGLQRPQARDSVLEAFLNGVREATLPTVVFSTTAIESNTVALSSALAGTPVVVTTHDNF